MTNFGVRMSLRLSFPSETRGTDSPLFAHKDAEALKSSLTPLRPWAPPVNKHAGVGADGVSALAPQTKLCHRRIWSHRLYRSTGRAGGVQGLGCRLAGIPTPDRKKKWELKSRTMKGKNYSPSFPSSGTEGANLPVAWHTQSCPVDFAALPMHSPRQVPPSPQLKRAGCMQGRRWISGPSGQPLVPPCLLTINPMPLYIWRSFLSFYFTVQLIRKSLGILHCLTVKIHMMYLH